jgi:hypothetical protein
LGFDPCKFRVEQRKHGGLELLMHTPAKDDEVALG